MFCHMKIWTPFHCFRFCFPLQMHTKCELHKSPIPCPFQKCRDNTCSTQPSARCRSFGCGSCDEHFLDVVSQTPVKCNENGYYNYHSFIFNVWLNPFACATCSTEENYLLLSNKTSFLWMLNTIVPRYIAYL